MSSDSLAVGFLGYRFMGRAHANALARLPMFFPEAPPVERRVLVGRDETALAGAADRLGFEGTATDPREAIDDVDVFYNLGPNHLHVEPSVAALERDVHVLCEKPLAPGVDGARRLADAADRSDAVDGVGFNYRFVPAVRYARELVAGGELGEITGIRARYLQDWLADPGAPWSWRNDAELAGSGALGDLGSHAIDLVRYLVGDRVGGVERVSGHLRTFVDERPVPDDGRRPGSGSEEGDSPPGERRRPVTVDDACSAQIAYENGAMGTLRVSRVATGHENDFTVAVHGTDGSLRFSLPRLNRLEVTAGDDRGYETITVTGPGAPYGDRWWPPGHALGWEHAVVHENFEFLSAVTRRERGSGGNENGTDGFDPSFADGLAAQRVLAAIERSDDRGEWVTVERN